MKWLIFVCFLSWLSIGKAQPIWVDSGAPIGDSSVFVYTGTWAGVILNMRYSTTNEDTIRVSNLGGAGLAGFHVYRVNSAPNYTTGLPGGTIRNGVYWGVFPVGNVAATYDVRLHYGTNSNLTVANEPTITVYNRDRNDITAWDELGGTRDEANNNIAFSHSGREEFILDSIVILPVENLQLSAQLLPDRSVSLIWTADREQQTESYRLERRTPTGSFEQLYSTTAAGFSDTQTKYSYTDKLTNIGRVYYRVWQQDLDGAGTYSNLATVSLNGDDLITVYPNPATDKIFIHSQLSNSGPISLTLTDALGRHIDHRTLSLQSGQFFHLNTTNLAPGAYFLEISSAQGPLFAQKIVKY